MTTAVITVGIDPTVEIGPVTVAWHGLTIAVGRFVEFFARSYSPDLALGLEVAQWTSLALLAFAAAGAWLTLRRRPAARGRSAASRPAPPR